MHFPKKTSTLLLILTIVTCLPTLATADNNQQSKQLIKHGFALRAQAIEIQSQTTNMIQSSRALDKTAIKFRLDAKKNPASNSSINPAVLNQASEHLNNHAANFRLAQSDIIMAAEKILREGFLQLWQKDLIHTEPMQIKGSFSDGKTSEFLKMSFSAQNKPDTLDTSIARPTSNGLYYVIIQSLEHPLQINQFHNWNVIVTDNNASPASNIKIAIKGDMPSHGHGMPTTPKVSSEQKPGIYTLEGMKFQMRGWWVISFTLEGEQGIDTVSFNLDL